MNERLVSPAEAAKKLDEKLENTSLWLKTEKEPLEYLAAGSGFSVLAGLLLTLILLRLGRREKRKHPLLMRWRIFSALSFPAGSFVSIAGIFLSSMPLLNTVTGRFYWLDIRIFAALLVLAAVWGIYRLLGVFHIAVRRYAMRDDNTLDELLVQMIHNTLQIVLAALTLLIIGQTIFELDITALLAGAGVAGLAVAFAAKDALANFFGTIVIILDHPFRLGDRIRINAIDGIVEDVGMRCTRLRTPEESLCILPNSLISSTALENVTKKGVLRYDFVIGLEYGTTPEQMRTAMDLLHQAADNFHGTDRPGLEPRIFFESFGSSALNIKVSVWLKTADFNGEEKLRTELNLEILEKFSAAGLSIAYPTTTTYVRMTESGK